MDELNQIERIKSKLIIAKKSDKNLKVFGADSHKYILGDTVTPTQILNFENEYEVKLPESYKAFLLHIGNGGISYANSAAGPSYGIYPLGKNTNEFIDENTKVYLKEDCKIYPNMTNEFWAHLIKNIEEDDDISNEDFNIELGKIFSGLLPIGSQGCSYCHALVLNGKFKGKVVNVDIDRQKPFFAFESNFLDWYERWLDEIIPENIMIDKPDLFKYTLAGNVRYILEVYFSSDDYETKIECLTGILKKEKIDSDNLDILEEEYKLSSDEIQKKILQILVKFDYNRAFSYLVDFAKKSLLDVFQFVFWYAKDKSIDWLDTIKSNIENINDDETFLFCTYLLKEMNVDYGKIIVPFVTHKNESIRVSAFYSLGQLPNKTDYIDAFIAGLNDSSNRVIHTTLQALNGVEDKKLLKYYKAIAEKFPVEKDYILANLNHRLKPFGLTNKTIKKIKTDS
ncbi:SMI1/KNR4 family protein [Flavobacterium aquidurense]|uniref:Putative glucan synthasis protein n=1 Tax=Flavobacterium aquidurense TaxID=362413 RepID=A0A0N8VLS5_9FLAO|nr:SMI1/KNR4 family protein [Flavobacterium aquidurense]KQB37340.1 putative glucan synthasis protein [Flavobacterium aquidurense]